MKKILPIIIAIIVVLALVIAGLILGMNFLKKGPAGKSLMDLAKEEGQKVMSKNEYISECQKSSEQESKDACYYYAAFMYRDPGLCGKIKDAELKKLCTRENIEKWYRDLKEGKVRSMGPEIFGVSGIPGIPTIPGIPGIPGVSPLQEGGKNMKE